MPPRTNPAFSACGSNNSRYPGGWPPLSAKSLAGGCSDLTGTCLFRRNDPDYDASTFGVLLTFFGDGEALQTQRSAREIAHRAVGLEAVIFLKLANACIGLTTEYAVNFQRC